MTVAENLNQVKSNIKAACERCGRSPSTVKLIAVSKSQPTSAILEAIAAGQTIFGENYVQEAREKLQEVCDGVEFHLIGPLQRNKAKDAIRIFSTIHSINREEIAKEIAKHSEVFGLAKKVLVQVNISGEPSKSGVAPDRVLDLCRAVLAHKSLQLCGLMSIGEESLSIDKKRAEFRLMKELKLEVGKKLGFELTELSMGMSADYQLAIEEGATFVRVGSAIFGWRI